MSDLKDPRVLFAAERTLLAWNRTSLALIAFGFLVERTGLLMGVFAPENVHSLSMIFTFWMGLAFICLGAGTAVYSSIQYAVVLKTLTPLEFPPHYQARWGMVVNVLVAILGFLLLFGLAFAKSTFS